MDMLAEKLDLGRARIRRKNILLKGEKNAFGEKIQSIGVRNCLDMVEESIQLNSPSLQSTGPWRRGKGIAIGGKQNAIRGRSEAEIVVHEDLTIEARYSADETGMGSETIMAQVVAEEFGISPENIRVVRGDTAITPYDLRSTSSFTTYNTGNAMRRASRNAIRQLFKLAAKTLKVKLKDLAIADGQIFLKNYPDRRIEIPDLFRPSSPFVDQSKGLFRGGGKIVGRGVFAPRPAVPWDRETGQTPRMSTWYQYNAFGVEVDVNTETGEVRVVKAVAAFDMGFPINPKMCEGQVEGGLGMGVGASILEEYIYNNGRMLNHSFGNYRIPTFNEVPLRKHVKVLFAPDPQKDGPWGAKGIGEGAMVSVGPAISNAIYDAVGIRLKDMPLNGERVLKALKEKTTREGN